MTIGFEVPQEVYRRAEAIAQEQKPCVADIVAAAIVEHAEAWDRLEKRAAVGDRRKFLHVLAADLDVEPKEHDRLER